ncbi:MAG: hypothetical protein AAB460_01970 [Patescibacteria group bacterium]
MTNQDKPKHKNFQIADLIKKIKTFLSDEKPSDILIIKAHLLCEYYINQILILREACSLKDMESFTFNEKIQKAFNLDDLLEKRTFDYVNRLNKLRNKVGHELEYTLSESDVDALGYVQGKEYILEKYDYETDLERLRNVLNTIVIDTALLLISSIKVERQKVKTTPETN